MFLRCLLGSFAGWKRKKLNANEKRKNNGIEKEGESNCEGRNINGKRGDDNGYNFTAVGGFGADGDDLGDGDTDYALSNVKYYLGNNISGNCEKGNRDTNCIDKNDKGGDTVGDKDNATNSDHKNSEML